MNTRFWNGARTRLALYLLITTIAVVIAEVPVQMAIEQAGNWPIWWPVAGVAVGLSLQAPRRYRTLVAHTAAVAVAGTLISQGVPVDRSLIVSVALLALILVADRIMRGRRDERPSLLQMRDLRTFVIATAAGTLSFLGVGAGGIALIDTAEGVARFLATSALSVLVGLTVVLPLFFEHGAMRRRTHRWELVAQWAAVAFMLVATAVLARAGLPAPFLLIGPLLWGAVRFGGLQTGLQFVGVSVVIASVNLTEGGLYAGTDLPITVTTITTQLFVLTLTAVMLTAFNLTGRYLRTLRIARATVAASPSGFAELEHVGSAFVLSPTNSAARSLLGPQPFDPASLFEGDSMTALANAANELLEKGGEHHEIARLNTVDGRTLRALIAPLQRLDDTARSPEGRRLSLQVTDVTDSVRLAEADRLEREHAAEVQRALLPPAPPRVDGWQVAGICRPAREIGGDFYTWSADDGLLVVSIGDIMGKGLGAGILAASMHTVVRHHESLAPGDLVNEVRTAIGPELERASSFATLFQARIEVASGALEYADAGHGLSMIVSSDGRRRMLSGTGLPVGIDDDARWQTESERLADGECLIAFSDGLLDAFPTPEEAYAWIAAQVSDCESATELVETIAAFADDPRVNDDITVIALRRLEAVDDTPTRKPLSSSVRRRA